MKNHARHIVIFIPLILVNAIAVWAQYNFWLAHLPWPAFFAFVFACALESIAIYLSFHAHAAQLSDDSSTRLRLASYVLGAIIGVLNASHYIHNGRLTAAAAGVGILSASSPWLWAIHSRRQSRDTLKEKGLIEPHAVRLGATRWLWHPYRSALVMWYATWRGINKASQAIEEWESARENTDDIPDAEIVPDETQPDYAELDAARTAADAVRAALRILPAASGPETAAWLAGHGWPNVSPAYVRTIRSADQRREIAAQRSAIHAVNGSPAALPLPRGNDES